MDGPFRLDRSLIRVSGPDTVGFLHNLLTQNVERLAEASVAYAALLSPQGKVICDMLLWDDSDDGVIIETDTARAADLLRRLSLYKLRAQISVEDITGRFPVLWAPSPFAGGAPDPRFPNGELGWREVSHLPAEQAQFADGTAAYEALRLAVGAPDLARDAASEEVFALEALLDELHGVDFQKGCFVGQENVSRMKRRATTRKKFCPIVFQGDAPAHGTALSAGPAEIGTVRTGMTGRALALLRLDRAFDALDAGHALTAAGKSVRLDPPPWLMLPQRQPGASGEAD